MSKTAVLCLSHYEGGMELDAIKQTMLFNQYGMDTVLICRKDTFLENRAKEQGVPVYSIRFRAKLSLSLILGLRKLIKEHQISNLVFFGTSEIKSIYFAVKWLNCKVFVRHGTTMSSPKTDPVHRLFYSCVSGYVGISQHLSRNILKIFPCRKEQIHTIYNSVNTRQRYTTRPDSKSFIHVGRVEESKGVFDAIKALGMAEIPDEYKSITFVGKATSADTPLKLQELADKSGVRIHFAGYQTDTGSFYQAHRYLLFPSYGEGLPNVVLEGLHYGLICITYDNTAFPEMASLGFKQFYTAEDRDTVSLAKSIETAVANDTDSDASEQTCTFETHFSDKKHAEKWKQLIH